MSARSPLICSAVELWYKKMLKIGSLSELTGIDTKIKVAGFQRLYSKWLWLLMAVYKPSFADPENEHLIQQALKELTKGKTVLMIAHRLSSITDADNILVIDKGKIAEQGTHANLLGKQGIYYHMWNEYQQSVRWTIGKEVSND